MPQIININPFARDCDCRHDLDHLTSPERKERLRYEHVQKGMSAATMTLLCAAMLGAFLMITPYGKWGDIQLIYPAASLLFMLCTPCAIFSAILKVVWWHGNKYAAWQRPCHPPESNDDYE